MAPSKTLFRRVLALRAQCRAFSGSVRQQQPPPRSNQYSDLMQGIFANAQQRLSEKKPVSDTSYLQSQLSPSLRPKKIEQETGFRTTDFDAAHVRRYIPGDIIAPHDLSFKETEKWRFNPRTRPTYDVFDVLGMDPSKEYKNYAMLGEFVTDMGRIKSASQTGLRRRNQRKVAKAVRRAIGLGLHPSVSRHPEILEGEVIRRSGKQLFGYGGRR